MSLLAELGHKVQNRALFERIKANLCPFHPLLGTGDRSSTWVAQRDQTQFINEFERIPLRTSKRLLYVP